jgi:hypothetical protein
MFGMHLAATLCLPDTEYTIVESELDAAAFALR